MAERVEEILRILLGATDPVDVEWVLSPGAVGRVVAQSPPRKPHVVQPDEELQEGSQVLHAGAVVGPGAVAALVARGVPEIPVYRRPRVVLFSTGDELSEPPAEPAPGKVFNTNASALVAEISRLGCEVEYRGILPDRPESLRAAFREVLSGSCDVVLTTGAVSVGCYDRVPQVWLELGAQKVAGRVDIRPGGPFFAARVGRRCSWSKSPRTVPWSCAPGSRPDAGSVSTWSS
ncbi:MAG: molybdopterin-binding protein [Armatimonadota bacterium]|nr:molybdopterin-binding protein [Armatimonadota bacterium]MDR5696321.1 molybdopterin-binding protein [Armatimonadota bacterium]